MQPGAAAELARQLGEQADAEVDAAFNTRYEQDRRMRAAVASIEAAGHDRWRRDQAAREAAAQAAAAGTQRFARDDDEEDDDQPKTWLS